MPALKADTVAAVLRKGGSARLDETVPARFAVGEAVRARNLNPPTHTRIPRYVRGHRGVVHCDHGVFVFADAHARGETVPQRLYGVRFSSEELWGPQGAPGAAVYVDLFESYLTPAT